MLALSCAEKFTGVPGPAQGGTSGDAAAGADADAGADTGPASSSSGGKTSTPASGGGSSGGKTGSVAGSGGGHGGTTAGGGDAGAGGKAGEEPPVPTDGLELWLRADRGITSSSSGAVSAWRDSSGNERNAAQISGNFRPLLVADALAGKPALVFDGVDDFLKLPALDLDFSRGVSIFIAMRQESTGDCDPYFEASTGSEENDLHFGDWNDAFNFEILEDVVSDPNYPLLLHEPRVAVAVQSADGWVHLRSNGNGAGERQVAVPTQVERTQVFIGKTLYASCNYFDGAIGELLLYNRGLEDAELVEVEQYLDTKWGCCGG